MSASPQARGDFELTVERFYMSKLSIKQQLILLVAMLVVAMLLVSGMGMKGMINITNSLKSVYMNQVVPMEQLKDVSDAYAVTIVATARKVNHGKISWDKGTRSGGPSRDDGEESVGCLSQDGARRGGNQGDQ